MDNAEFTLIQQILAGRRDCYRPLVEKYQKKVFLLANSMIHNTAEAQDIAQETFLLAYRKLRELKDLTKFSSWLFGITRNLCYTRLRQKKVEPESLEAIPAYHNSLNIISLKPNQDEGEDLQDLLLKRLKKLPEKYQTLLRLKYLDDYSYQEISEMLDLPIDLVRSRLFEGRRILREGMQKARRVNNEG